MTTVPLVTKNRNYKRKKGRNKIYSGAGLGCSLLISLLLIFGSIVISIIYITLTRELPSLEIFPTYLDPPDGILLNPTVLYDRSGKTELLKLIDPAVADSEYFFLKRQDDWQGDNYLSVELVKAIIANIEPNFWDSENHLPEILFDGGDNLLAQSLVIDVALWDEPPGLLRDLRTRLLASQIITQFGKEKVLEWYLNSTKFGDLIYGADAASHVYFGKSASQLNLAEGSMLSVIAQAPDINPHSVPELALNRQQALIHLMWERGVITEDEAKEAIEENLIFSPDIKVEDASEPFTKYVLDQAAEIIPRERLERGGINIITTMDYELQKQTRCTLVAHVARIEGKNEQISTIDGESCEAARLLPTVLLNSGGDHQGFNTAAAVSDPGMGQLLALVMISEKNDRTSESLSFPSGTVLTPYIYLTAFTRGLNSSTMIWDIPEDSNQSIIAPPASDFDDLISSNEPYKGPMRLRTAHANDYLRPTVRIIEQIGSENVLSTLTKFGLGTDNRINNPIDINELIFEEDISMVETIRAYGILANRGVLAGQSVENSGQDQDQSNLELSAIVRIEDALGNLLLDWSSPESRSIVSPQLAYLITHVLSDESARWESLGHPNPLEIGRSAAVKMSRTLDGSGAWVLGYVPNRVVGVWIESKNNNTQQLIPNLSTPLWHAIAQYTLQEEPVLNWEVPPGIEMIEVCDPSGLLPSSYCPLVVTEVFLSGQEPTHADTLYRSFQINRETGNLATVFTPPELIDQRVYMVVPPHIEEWAREHDLPIPPDSFDAVAVTANELTEVQISSPEIFSHVSGTVLIEGSAGGSGFSYYRVQVGQGLNPDEWIQIGEDFENPVRDDVLVAWDTSELRGLYAVQLLVVYEDQRVDKFVLQVTVDNQEPEVLILSPKDGQQISMLESDTLILRADASDDLELEEVEFYLDDRLLAEVRQSPYIIPWNSTLGDHSLLVQAADLAGNVTQDYIEFSVIR